MLLGNSNEKNTGHEADDNFIAGMIRDGRCAEAYSTLSMMRTETVAGYYNMALCLIRAGKYAEALLKIEKAIILVESRQPAARLNPDRVLSELDTLQAQCDTHTHPVTEKYAAAFPERTKESLLRLKVDCLAELGQKSEVIRVAALLRNKKFTNVEDALSKIR